MKILTSLSLFTITSLLLISCTSASLIFSDSPISNERSHIVAGEKLYQTYCFQCHGDNADGKGIMAKQLSTAPANLINLNGRPEGVNAFRITEGGPVMPAWKNVLSEKEIWQLARFIKHLKTS